MSCIRLAVLAFIVAIVAGCVSAKSIEGYVVDAETGEPVPDVIVVVAWRVLTGLHGQTKGFLVLDEALTDEKGYYFLRGWEGKYPGFFAALDKRSPELNYFKYGYELEFRSNKIGALDSAPIVSPRESVWSGKKIHLQPYHGDDTGRFSTLSEIDGYYVGHWGCTAWKLPILTDEIRRLRNLAKKLPGVGTTRLPVIDSRNKPTCIYSN